MSTIKYTGARYLLKFYDEWVQTDPYEALGVVQVNGFTYISKQPVPAGVEITNTDFWLKWADPNAQMEQLRQLVEQYRGELDDIEQAIADVVEALDSLRGDIAAEAQARAEGISAEATARETADQHLAEGIITEQNERISADASLLAAIEKITPKPLEYKHHVYVACNSGDDDNPGTQDTPFKTIDRAFKEYEYGYDNLYIHLIEAGNYPTLDLVQSNMTYHLDGSVPGVKLIFDVESSQYTDSPATFYNIYAHFENLEIECTTGFHADASSIYCNNNVTWSSNEALIDLSLGSYSFNATTIKNSRLLIRHAIAYMANLTFDYAEPTQGPVYIQNSHAFLAGNVTYNLLNSDADFTFLDMQSSIVSTDWSFSTFDRANKFTSLVRIRNGNFYISGTNYQNAKNFSRNGYLTVQRAMVVTVSTGYLVDGSGITLMSNTPN